MIAGTQAWWFLSRGSGIVAWAMLAATNLWGILMVTRIFKPMRPAWTLDLHRWLGALAIITLAIHIGGLVADGYVHFGWREILVPQGSAWKTGAVTWGVVSLYLLLVIELTSLMMKRLPRKVWHSIHLSSYALFASATVHGALAGTDSGNRLYVYTVALMIAVAAIGLVIRIVRSRDRRFHTETRVVFSDAIDALSRDSSIPDSSIPDSPATIGLASSDVLLGREPSFDRALAGASGATSYRHASSLVDEDRQPIDRFGSIPKLRPMGGRDHADLPSEFGDHALGDGRR